MLKQKEKLIYSDEGRDTVLIPGVGMWDGHVVTKSDKWVSSGHSGFLPLEDNPNANIGVNEHD